jgi:5-methylcytosine-specific restriction endonuclease McrA
MARQYIPVELKNQVFDRAKGICEYCYSQAKFSPNNCEIEYIVPVSREGTTTSENLALACPSCNSYKSNKIEAIAVCVSIIDYGDRPEGLGTSKFC